MLHILLGIILLVVGIGLIGTQAARSSIAARRGSGDVVTAALETGWLLPAAGVVLILVGILSFARVF